MSAPGTIERGLAVVLLILSTGAFLNLSVQRGKFYLDPNAGLPYMQIIWSLLYLCVLYFLISQTPGFWRTLLMGWPFLLFLLITVLSIIWSDAKGLTARRSLALVPTTFTGFYFASRYPFKEQLKLLLTVSKFCVTFSLIFGALHLGTAVDSLIGPAYGVFVRRDQVGSLTFLTDFFRLPSIFGMWNEPWYGIFVQRNTLGVIMALATFVFFLWSRMEPEEKWSGYLWASLSLLLIVLSGSLTGFLGLCVFVGGWKLLRVIRKHRQWAGRIFVATALLASLGIYYFAGRPESVASFFDRDVTLTGRTTIWGASLVMGMDHPWIGHGFNAFWLGDEGPSGEVRRIAGWDVPSGHNGFLDIWLDLGIAGLAVFFVGFVRHFWESIRYFLGGEGSEGSWPVLFLVFLAVINLAQSSLVAPNFFFWILYVVVSFRLSTATDKPAKEVAA